MTSLSESDRLAQPREERLDLPDRSLFWKWVWSAVRPVLGWVLAALGALALFLGWYGVSGQALTSKQIPYLVSGGLTGIALIVMAGVFLATEDIRRQLSRLDRVERQMSELYALFVDDLADPSTVLTLAAAGSPDRAVDAESLIALPSGTSYHRPSCALVTGKDSAARVDEAQIRERELRACRVCDPEQTQPTG